MPSGRLQGGGLTKGKVSLLVSPHPHPIAHVWLPLRKRKLWKRWIFPRSFWEITGSGKKREKGEFKNFEFSRVLLKRKRRVWKRWIFPRSFWEITGSGYLPERKGRAIKTLNFPVRLGMSRDVFLVDPIFGDLSTSRAVCLSPLLVFRMGWGHFAKNVPLSHRQIDTSPKKLGVVT